MKKILFFSIILILGIVLAKGQPCPDSLYLTSQAQIDSFLILYPKCAEIEGGVWISGDDITSLNGLGNLTSIGEDLRIDKNPVLTNLSGLENVNSIGGDLRVESNDTLTSISGLEGLTSVGGGLGISHNGFLSNLEGLEELTSVGNYLSITNNDDLTNLSGLDNVTSIGGMLYTGYNYGLINLSGLEGLTFVGGNLWITYNSSLTSLSGLNNLTFVGGHLAIGFGYTHGGDGNNSLMNLTGLEGLTSIGGGLWIGGNFSLTTLIGLDNITSIGGDLMIFDNESLTSLTGLEAVTSIGGDLIIGYFMGGNPSLTNLTGLEGVTSIEGYLEIWRNDVLSSLTGIDNIVASTIDSVMIYKNPLLSTCEVLSVCDYLAVPGGIVKIHDNAPGCNSPEEVQDSCEANAVRINEQFIKENLFIYPNPAKQKINISAEGFSIDEVAIYTLTGQQLFLVRPRGEAIDISHLQPGMYIVEVMVEDRKIRRRLLVYRR